MTPAARVQAAIEILDEILAGKAAEQALTGWSRRSRYAGSKDRVAVRDHVFDVMRRMRSFAALGGARNGRGLMLGAMRHAGSDPETVFTGVAYAPAGLTDAERSAGQDPDPGPEALDIPDWLWPRFTESLSEESEACAKALQDRAPVHLRVNLAKGDVPQAQDRLLQDGIATISHPAASTALEITEGARRLRQSEAYQTGLVELQDAASQAVVEALPLRDGMRVLDYCAGGGGKALAMASRARVEIFAHDVAPDRMRDLPARAARAGATISAIPSSDLKQAGPFDLVLCDAPCSGSGAWRRAPEGKWRLDETGLQELCGIQVEILETVSGMVADDGLLAYATCSVLRDENQGQIERFLKQNGGWRLAVQQQWTMQHGTDGFYTAHLTRDTPSI
ncbi:RsmB/NOP family class I SAM-dependent RNA methyltransferase [Sedimentitalea todarodis]|uniref:RsmB/NOP family class I SAM-dependent RNA methyltransferase n=1 Tax=Sedimentitalea todarodis TaxID=1631240 RepID=A0ABU3VC14_9RHOB|nr:RsmB/NOP family class I SAM-dependent RNA methyltransferase [Sedimentitalea todarodis]MDU9003720.1 RsmB/NOP family class I SAM-dependent RNA methyltransferase [Sedimentitalea todarodis]